MNVLVIGSGAREHALVRSLAADPGVDAIVVAPGNAGIDGLAQCRPVDVADPAAIAGLAAELGPDLVVIGPEVPLVAGAADAVRARGIPCFGPSAEAARLEGSKAFAKEVMAACEVPSAMAHVCTNADQAALALDAFGPPYVVKDDGLAAGKGVIVTDDRVAALEHASACFDRPGGTVLVEEYLDGPEVSLFCITDGTTVVPLAPAQDFKRVGDGDEGANTGGMGAYSPLPWAPATLVADVVPLAPAQDFKRVRDGDEGANTGGMGAYSPLPWAPATLVADVVERVAQPVIDELAKRGTPFVGVLYCGLALTGRGVRVIEFNARFGDPETQVVLPRLVTPLGGLLLAAATGKLADVPPLRWRDEAAVTVVLAAEHYPATPRTGDPLAGLEDADGVEGAWVLHAGTRRDDAGRVVSSGGRVLSVVGMGEDLAGARHSAYDAVQRISLDGSHYRRDIAERAAAGTVPTL